MATLCGIFCEQDGGFREQADEHDETHLQVDVVLDTKDLGKQKRASQSERYAEDDSQGDEQALVEGHHDEIDENCANEEDDKYVARCLALFTGYAAELDAITYR